MLKFLHPFLFALLALPALAQLPVEQVNVFLGTSADHGQLSPATSYPFSMLSLGPQTYPNTHTGYEHLARTFLGFTHTRFEGVGCQGAGGNLLVKPFLGADPAQTQLLKKTEAAGPGYYGVTFANGLGAELTVGQRFGLHRYHFPAGAARGLALDLAYSFANGFKQEEHATNGPALSGWLEAGTTCGAGTYRLYYYLEISQPVQWEAAGAHQLVARLPPAASAADVEVRVAFSSVSVEAAQATVQRQAGASFAQVRQASAQAWNALLSRVRVQGPADRERLFYSLLYRTLQSPYVVSEPDGRYRATDGSVQLAQRPIYNGWAVWDNYHTQLPLLSLAYPTEFQDIVASLANLYRFGKKDYATQHEPSPTVRTEHASVVLLDAARKGYAVDLRGIRDSLISQARRLDYGHPDKALESSYDTWALAQILTILKDKQSAFYQNKALEYKGYWQKDFQDLTRPDVDRLPARGLYQGTIWQYRWNVPFDVRGLRALAGGEEAFRQQLDTFFGGDYYNHANETDLQAPTLYNATQQPWKSQALVHQLAADTVVQHYFNDNSRGIDPYVGRIYQNQPQAYLRTMDDDAGAMSAWYVLAASGVLPACVGEPVYYLNLPLFEKITLQVAARKPLVIEVENYAPGRRYIQAARLNGQPLNRNWLTHQELAAGGTLVFVAADAPNLAWGTQQQWLSGAAAPNAERR